MKGLQILFNVPHAPLIESKERLSQKQVATLHSSKEQFTEQGALLRDMDKDIVATIQAEDKLEAEVAESAVIQEAISVSSYTNPESFCPSLCTKWGNPISTSPAVTPHRGHVSQLLPNLQQTCSYQAILGTHFLGLSQLYYEYCLLCF